MSTTPNNDAPASEALAAKSQQSGISGDAVLCRLHRHDVYPAFQVRCDSDHCRIHHLNPLIHL